MAESKKSNTPNRPKRKPLVNSLNTPMQDFFASFHEEGFKYYAPREDEGYLIQQMLDAWWEYVKDSNGNVVQFKGKGNTVHVLLRQPEEYWQEDFSAQQRRVDETESYAGELSQMGYLPKGKGQMIEDDYIK